MATVKLLKQVGNRQPGEVLRYLDSASARNLVEVKKVAEYFDPDAPAAPADPDAPADPVDETAERSAPRRGGVIVTQVVEEDNPNKPATDPDEAGEGDDDAEDSTDADQ